MTQVAPAPRRSSRSRRGSWEVMSEEEEEKKKEVICKPSWKRRILSILKEQLLLILLLLSIVIGLVLGISLRSIIAFDDVRTISFLNFPGELLMRMLKMLILPLIVSSLIAGLSELDAKASSSLGSRALIYYLITTLIAVIIGVGLVLIIRPGAGNPEIAQGDKFQAKTGDTADAFLDLLRNMFPDNLAVATFKSSRTVLEKVINQSTGEVQMMNNETVTQPVLTLEDGTNVLGLVVFSVVLGIIVARMGPQGRPVADFFVALSEAIMRMVSLVIWFSPVGIAFLITTEIVKMEDPSTVLQQLGLYIATVLVGVNLHGFVILPLIYLMVTKNNPLRFMVGISEAMATAFGTSSSSATLAVTYRCLEDKIKVDKRVTRFVLPVGATVNMNGTALYEAVAPIFIAQLNNIALSAGQVITISITATCAAVGAASIPQAGLVTMLIVLTAAGLPTDDVAKIIAVDWFLDRFRTMVNVMGDSFGAAIVFHLSRKELESLNDDELSEAQPLSPEARGYQSMERNTTF